ncbi:MAG TPA: hypothetical protein VFW67_00660, partial [Burkholderiaceae bacterium]|nr:hypothetical protein [Burkholderiaceae bacterium]
MRNKHGMYLGWALASVLAVGTWMAGDRAPAGEIATSHPPTWTGPAAETEDLWPQLVLPLLLLGAVAVGHSHWQARRHRQQLHGLQVDMQEGLEAQNQLLTLANLLP